MAPPFVRAGLFVLLCALAACGGPRARLSYAPTQSSYPAPGPEGDPWGPYIEEASQRFGVPAPWIRAVMHQESGGQEYLDGRPITSSAGAMGLMQLMPATYGDLQAQYGLGEDPYDPRDNIMAGTAYIRQMYDKYGSPGFLAAYNAGPARVDDYLAGQGGLPAETENYVASIAPHLGDADAPVEVAQAEVAQAEPAPPSQAEPSAPAASADPRCWHDPNMAYDPSTPCVSPPVVEALPEPATQPAVVPASYAPATTAIGRYDALPPPSGMTPPPPIVRTTFSPPSRATSGAWSVQVGAFGRPEEARFATTMAQRAAPSLGASRSLVTTVGGLGGHPLYRARLAGLDRATAATACNALRDQAMACMLVAPGS